MRYAFAAASLCCLKMSKGPTISRPQKHFWSQAFCISPSSWGIELVRRCHGTARCLLAFRFSECTAHSGPCGSGTGLRTSNDVLEERFPLLKLDATSHFRALLAGHVILEHSETPKDHTHEAQVGAATSLGIRRAVTDLLAACSDAGCLRDGKKKSDRLPMGTQNASASRPGGADGSTSAPRQGHRGDPL